MQSVSGLQEEGRANTYKGKAGIVGSEAPFFKKNKIQLLKKRITISNYFVLNWNHPLSSGAQLFYFSLIYFNET